MNPASSFQAWVAETTLRLEQCLTHYLEGITYPAETLQKAMIYSTLGSGKRIRSLLIYATGQIFSTPLTNLDLAAIAIEMVHAYSLVHDDLPAMDNSDLRRGRLACHKAFGEDLAILAGDALLTLAFEILADYPAELRPEQRLAMVQLLSYASGPAGMVSGQVLDMAKAGTSEKALIEVYRLKTGALIQASVKLGLIASEIQENEREALENYAQNISLAFQIQDDVLDIEGEDIGKPKQLDELNDKQTYPRLMGMEKAKSVVDKLFKDALVALEIFGERAKFLRELTEYVGKRKN